jgi:hypothetical protein
MIKRIGKRERVARKKRFRGSVSYYDKKTAGWLTLKLGHKKMMIQYKRSFSSVGG